MSFFALILPLCAILTSGWQKEGRAPASPREAAGQWGAARRIAARRRAARWWGGRKQAEMFPVGSYVAAVYDGDCYVARWRARSRRRRLRATLS